MSARVISIVRDERRGSGVEGRLFLDGLLVGPTLERLAVMIAPGLYQVAYHTSPKHPRTLMILVPGRRWILIHPGGVPEHSEGCVLLGATDHDGARISGGAPLCRWLAAQLFADDGSPWTEGEIVPLATVIVHEIGGDVADGKTI